MRWPITWRMLRSPRFYCMLGLMAVVAVLLAGVPVGTRDQRALLALFTLGILVV